ncbi:MAG: metallophosphatase [Verrucomicrobia bacterium]|nr:metallophosphatase [Verrucomicrobiota bacterium]
MRTLIHLSDLHFGRVDATIIEPLVAFIKKTKPDLVAISGDFTQRARPSQFKEARLFLDRIPFPWLAVPGNHDIPFYNLAARFLRPLHQYRRHICSDLAPFFHDEEIAVVGLNTARSLTTKYGRLNEAQLKLLAQRFRKLEHDVVRVVVTHHPFDLPANYRDHRQLVGRAVQAIDAIAASGVDLILSGHLHLAHTGLTASRYKVSGHSALVVQAGTATSTRGRGEANSFNVLRLEPSRIVVERILWNPKQRELARANTATFVRESEIWRQA